MKPAANQGSRNEITQVQGWNILENHKYQFLLAQKNLTGVTTLSQSGPGNDGNEEVLGIPQSSSITGTSPSDCLVSYPGYSMQGRERSYPSAEVQLVYSITPADWLEVFGMIWPGTEPQSPGLLCQDLLSFYIAWARVIFSLFLFSKVNIKMMFTFYWNLISIFQLYYLGFFFFFFFFFSLEILEIKTKER